MIPKNLILPKFDPNHIHSKYWLRYVPSEGIQKNQSIYTMYLASIQRGISSMVNSLGRNTKKIDVSFGLLNDSDNSIVVHNPQTPQEIDLSVGMALHESSHLLLSDGDSGHPDAVQFYFLTKTFFNGNPKLNFGVHPTVEKLGANLGISLQKTYSYIEIIANFIEDVRVNNWVLSTSYGYREYYSAMFELLWHTKEITESLNSPEAQERCVQHYIGHILNMFNPNKIPVQLPQFDEIVRILDLENVAKYGHDWNKPWNSYENIPLLWRNANTILQIIYENSEKEFSRSPEVDKAVNSLIEKTLGEIPEKNIIKDTNFTREVDEAANLNAELVMESTKDMQMDGDDEFPILFFDYFNQRIIEKPTPFSSPTPHEDSIKAIEDGVRMGNLLAHKIRMFQDESREETLRKPKGRIDKRLLANIANGDSNIFKETYIVRSTPIHVHISVDASGSMRTDEKWKNALMLCVALAKVADKIRNFDVTISMRSSSTAHVDFGLPLSDVSSLNPELAAIGYVYDSRKDHFSKILKLFSYLGPYGSTPEGILFENIIKYLAPISTSNEVIFINLSDGQPHMTIYPDGKPYTYSGTRAHYHTHKKVAKMRRLGIHVLSYFIETVSSGRSLSNSYMARQRNNFEEMYGASAVFINPTQIGEVARSINRFTLTLHSKRS